MPPTGPDTRRRSGPPTLRGSGARIPDGRRPTDLNDRGFLDRFLSDIGTIFTNAPRALLNIVGAPVSDAFSLLPGGSEARVPSATGNLLKEIATSVGRSGAELVGGAGGLTNLPVVGDDIAARIDEQLRGLGPLGQKTADVVESEREFKKEHPGLALVEDIGNYALVGAGAGKGLSLGATRAAGVSTKGLNRAGRRAVLEDIANSGGPGSRLATTSLASSDLIGHPYRALGRGLRDASLPGRHSLGEVADQVRATTPAERMVQTPEMRDAATLRSLRGEVEALSSAADDAGFLKRTQAQARLAEFEAANADRLPLLESQRLAPLPIDDLTSPAARGIREFLNTEFAQAKTEPFIKARREVKGRVQQLREDRTNASLDILTVRDPGARKMLAYRNLRDLDKALKDEGGLTAVGVELPSRFDRVRDLTSEQRLEADGQLLEALNRVAANPELRAKLPRLESTLDLTRLDLYESINELPEGSLRNQLVDDATLTPDVANRLRDLQRAGDTLPPEVQSVVERSLGKAYRIPQEQLDNPVSAHPEIVDAYGQALTQLTKEAADTDLILAEYGLGDPDRWALRVTREGGQLRAMRPDESPTLRPAPSKDQSRTLRKLGSRVQAARRAVDDAVERANDQNVAARSTGYDDYRKAVRVQRRAATEWDKARRAGDVELADRLRGELDAAREKVRTAKAEQRGDVVAAASKAQRAIEQTIRDMAQSELPVGATHALGEHLDSLRVKLDAVFDDADLTMRPGLAKALEVLDEAGVDLQAVDANALDNILRLKEVGEGDVATFRNAVELGRAAVDRSANARGRAFNVENLIRAEERAKVQLRGVKALERRLDGAEGRLSELDPDAIDAARVRLADATDALGAEADRLGVARPRKNTPAEQRAFEDRILKAQVQARLRQRELERTSAAFDRIEAKFAELEAEMRSSIDAAPAVARPVLEVGRRMQEVDAALREAGLTQVADDLDLGGIPKLLDDMGAAGVSPTFLRRLEERVAAVGDRAASEQPVKTGTLSRQRRRTMSDIDLRRDIDRVKVESDVALAGRVLAGEMVDHVHTKYGRTMDQIAESIIEDPNVALDRNAWRDMTKHQREKLLQDRGYNVYAPEQIFSFKVRRTGADDVWVPQFLNDALTEFSKQGTLEKFLTGVVNPATTTWKHFILALRPAWQVYNVVGNVAMASVGGGVPVRDYLEFMRPAGDARKLMREYRLGWDLSERGLTPELAGELLNSGLSRDLAPNGSVRQRAADAFASQEAIKRFADSRVGQNAGRGKRTFDRAVSGSYRINSFMDNLNRSSLYLYDTLKAEMSPEDAIRHVNVVLGDYSKMTPFEKVYIRSAFPFYAWMRHITRLTGHMLGPDNITRTAILGTLVNTFGQPNEIEALFPEYMAGDIALGSSGMALGMRGFNPWQDVLDLALYNGEISTRGATRSMHPGIQFAIERNTGINTMTGRPFSRPRPILDDLGREIPTAPDLLTHARQKFAPPQVDLATNLFRKATGQTTARFDTDEPVLIEGAREPSLLGGLGSFLGAPLRSIDLEGVEERRAKAMDRVARQIARYNEEVEAYEEQRRKRSIPERLLPFGG